MHQTNANRRERNLRSSQKIRDLVSETEINLSQIISPLFIKEGLKKPQNIDSMPGTSQHSPDSVLKEVETCLKQGIKNFLIFGIPQKKDSKASQAYAKNGIVQKSIQKIKKKFPEALIISDTCLCEYMSHGHCGLVDNKGKVLNDPTLKLLAKAALSQAEAGADIIAPSDMMDFRVREIRKTLDQNNFSEIPIMSYAAKYASSFYGPFRDAAESSPQSGDRKTYQMDYRNSKEAIKEIQKDIQEGADILIIKPAMSYLDIIFQASKKTQLPVFAYQVSGEYSMIHAAANQGWLDLRQTALESLFAIKRAGATGIITYFAKNIKKWL